MVGALLAGIARRSFLSLTAVFVLGGFALGEGGAGVLELDAGSGFVRDLAIVALIVILFRDGLEVESEMLQREWHLPFRKLVLAMPITAVLIAARHPLADRPRLDRLVPRRRAALSHRSGAVVGGRDQPAGPAARAPLAQPGVGHERRPRAARAVLAFTAALAGEEDFVWWRFVLQDVTLGLVFGVRRSGSPRPA